jgi:lipopolysaccharide/colanic/teichoic acid biosynthesis glycosyltransferase
MAWEQVKLRDASMNRTPGIRLSPAFQRFFDTACSAVGLLFLAPMLAGIALVIMLDDGPPVFFTQTRIGKKGKPFRIWKFRTMHCGRHGSVITAAGDDRITRAGARLRKYKLDELPQLFNVFKGDMSLVGPRPEVPEHVRVDAAEWQTVLHVRPGITDLATLVYRDEELILGASSDPDALYRESVLPAKLLLNIAYLVSRSFLLDLKLIVLTIRSSFFAESLDPDLVKRTFGAGVSHE